MVRAAGVEPARKRVLSAPRIPVPPCSQGCGGGGHGRRSISKSRPSFSTRNAVRVMFIAANHQTSIQSVSTKRTNPYVASVHPFHQCALTAASPAMPSGRASTTEACGGTISCDVSFRSVQAVDAVLAVSLAPSYNLCPTQVVFGSNVHDRFTAAPLPHHLQLSCWRPAHQVCLFIALA